LAITPNGLPAGSRPFRPCNPIWPVASRCSSRARALRVWSRSSARCCRAAPHQGNRHALRI